MIKYFLIFICILNIAWCSSAKSLSDEETLNFDRYIFKRSKEYVSRDPVSIDNQQILNQIMGIYEFVWEEFTKNLIIASSKIKEGLDWLQFMTLNASKLTSEIKWLVSDGYNEIIIECGDKEINAYIHQLHLNHQDQTHYMLQLYFVDQWQGYILSAYTDNSDDIETYRSYFKTLTCN